ncbi:MAG TPA: hypothetical protein VF306_11485, partial [Pirellulales bacterium]
MSFSQNLLGTKDLLMVGGPAAKRMLSCFDRFGCACGGFLAIGVAVVVPSAHLGSGPSFHLLLNKKLLALHIFGVFKVQHHGRLVFEH